jgi:hypothetical protein
MDGENWIDGYRARLTELGAKAAAAAHELAGVSATAWSRDGVAAVTVDAVGSLRRVSFGPDADRLTPARLATAVVEAAERAQSAAAREAATAMSPLVGSPSAAARLLRGQWPDAVDGARR